MAAEKDRSRQKELPVDRILQDINHFVTEAKYYWWHEEIFTIAISSSSLNWVSFSFHMNRVIIYDFDIKLNSGDQNPDENYVEDKAFILIP